MAPAPSFTANNRCGPAPQGSAGASVSCMARPRCFGAGERANGWLCLPEGQGRRPHGGVWREGARWRVRRPRATARLPG